MGDDAIDSALRALRYRDRSAWELERRLEEQGFSDGDRTHALETLRRTGLVDDVRFARARADSLVTRGSGDELVRHALHDAGVHGDLVEDIVAGLEPEIDRARRIVAARGSAPKTARYLRARGFSHDVVASAVATRADEELR